MISDVQRTEKVHSKYKNQDHKIIIYLLRFVVLKDTEYWVQFLKSISLKSLYHELLMH